MSKRVVVASGYFNPLHYGHVSYLQKAKDQGDCLIVIVNNDQQLGMKHPKPPIFMPARERVKLVRSLACVDCALEAIDDDLTVCQTLRKLHPDVFANGGQAQASPEEAEVCGELGIRMLDGLGVELLVLQPYTQHYDWGKPREESLVAKMAGHEANNGPTRPYAELWMGDHPSGPSSVKSADGGESWSLRSTLRRSPSMLGEKLKKDGQLPFLLKILSIHKALSIQAHPDKVRAQVLHAEKPNIYKDGNHKPEIAIALTEFEALCGFRPVEQIVRFFDHVPEFVHMLGKGSVDELRAAASGKDENRKQAALKAAFCNMMHQPDDVVKEQLQLLVQRVKEVSTDDGLHLALDEAFALVERLNSQFPLDIGIFQVFLLNYAKMHVGDCLYMPQNTPHAYLSGDIVECMACSDNVVRGGLTSKFKDVDVLCEMLNYKGGPPPMISPQELAPGTRLYADSELEEFQVTHMKIPAGGRRSTCFSRHGPAIVICYHGTGTVHMSDEGVPLSPGACFMLAAGVEPEIVSEADLDIFVACCPPQYFNPQE